MIGPRVGTRPAGRSANTHQLSSLHTVSLQRVASFVSDIGCVSSRRRVSYPRREEHPQRAPPASAPTSWPAGRVPREHHAGMVTGTALKLLASWAATTDQSDDAEIDEHSL
jgi:hypothetical protein